jgi:hypothetical protein
LIDLRAVPSSAGIEPACANRADAFINCMEDDMSELEMTNEAETETEAFTDDLSDEALDRKQGGGNQLACMTEVFSGS